MEWTAFYTEGRVFRSETVHWTALPFEGLVWLVVRYKGRRAHWKGDWYAIELGGFLRVPPSSPGQPWSAPFIVSCRSCLKKGGAVSDDEFERIRELAWNEPWL